MSAQLHIRLNPDLRDARYGECDGICLWRVWLATGPARRRAIWEPLYLVDMRRYEATDDFGLMGVRSLDDILDQISMMLGILCSGFVERSHPWVAANGRRLALTGELSDHDVREELWRQADVQASISPESLTQLALVAAECGNTLNKDMDNALLTALIARRLVEDPQGEASQAIFAA